MQAIYTLGERGILDSLSRKWITSSKTCEMPAALLDPPSHQLDIGAFRGLWYMNFVFMAAALVFTVLERLVLLVFHR